MRVRMFRAMTLFCPARDRGYGVTVRLRVLFGLVIVLGRLVSGVFAQNVYTVDEPRTVAVYGNYDESLYQGTETINEYTYPGNNHEGPTINNTLIITGNGTVLAAHGAFSTTDRHYTSFISDIITGNSVEIKGGTVTYTPIGNWVSGGSFRNPTSPLISYVTDSILIENNSVTVSDGSTVNLRIYGGAFLDNSLTKINNTVILRGNHVSITDSTVTESVDGAYYNSSGQTGHVLMECNTVNVSDSTVIWYVYGGSVENSKTLKTDSIAVKDNHVTVGNNSKTDAIWGGYVGFVGYEGINADIGSILMENNSAFVDGKSNVGTVYGSEMSDPSNYTGVVISDSVIIQGNRATVTDSSAASVYGVRISSFRGTGDIIATNNTATVKNSTVKGYSCVVYGVSLQTGVGTNTAYNNTVTIDNVLMNGTSSIKVYGAYANPRFGNAMVYNNQVTINGLEQMNGNINNILMYGGYAICGDIVEGEYVGEGDAISASNTVTITDSTTRGSITGGMASILKIGSATAAANTVSITATTVGADITGGHAATTSTDSIAATEKNIVTIQSGSIVSGTVYGGYARNTNTTSGVTVASGNEVTINGSTVDGRLYGGMAWSSAGSATAENNSITIESGTIVNNHIYGGYAYDQGSVGNTTATGNSLTLDGVTVTGNVYAGRAYGVGSVTATATDNTLTIKGDTRFGTTTVLYGGNVVCNGIIVSAGNMFNLYSAVKPDGMTNTIKAAGLSDFQNLNFFMPDPTKHLDILLDLSDTANITDATVGLAFLGNTTPLRGGDHVVLINTPNAANLIGNPANDHAIAKLGVTLIYDFHVYVPGMYPHQLWAELPIGSITSNPKAEVLSKGFLTGASLLNQAADLVDLHDMSSAMNRARPHECERKCECECRCRCYNLFCDYTGGWSRCDTGCNVDMSSLSLIAGAAKYTNRRTGQLMTAAFLEYGNGDYDTFKMFDDGPLRGHGNAHYLGGGLMGRMSFTNIGRGRFYTEGSMRAGAISNNYFSPDLHDSWGNAAGYDSDTRYFGMHTGFGLMWYNANRSSYNLFCKYFWTHLQGDSVTLTTGDPMDFKAIDSQRMRLGGRSIFPASNRVNTYIGAAWEHEFSGIAHASTYSIAHAAPSLMGGTGIGEAGISWKPSAMRDCHVDLGVQGYIGKREGASANLLIGRYF